MLSRPNHMPHDETCCRRARLHLSLTILNLSTLPFRREVRVTHPLPCGLRLFLHLCKETYQREIKMSRHARKQWTNGRGGIVLRFLALLFLLGPKFPLGALLQRIAHTFLFSLLYRIDIWGLGQPLFLKNRRQTLSLDGGFSPSSLYRT
jgi:hypothetical protein